MFFFNDILILIKIYLGFLQKSSILNTSIPVTYYSLIHLDGPGVL